MPGPPTRTDKSVCATLVLLLVFIASCRQEPSRKAAAPPSQSSEFESLPSRNAYAGSASCKECHEKDFERWSHDWHARALAPANSRNVAGDFGGRHFRGESS